VSHGLISTVTKDFDSIQPFSSPNFQIRRMYPKVKKVVKSDSKKNRVLSIWYLATIYVKIESCYVSTADTREDGVVSFRCIYFQPLFEKPDYEVL